MDIICSLGTEIRQPNKDKFTSVKASGFTLAEVLITLGIIGVVASMTMSVLINNINDKKFESTRLKAVSTVANGCRHMLANEEVFEINNLEMWNCPTKDCYIDYLSKYFKIVKSGENLASVPSKYLIPKKYQEEANMTESQFSFKDNYQVNDTTYKPQFVFITSDGMMYGFQILAEAGENKNLVIAADINGQKNPNSEKNDLYLFKISNNGNVTDITNELLKKNNSCSFENLSECNTETDCENAGGIWLEGPRRVGLPVTYKCVQPH